MKSLMIAALVGAQIAAAAAPVQAAELSAAEAPRSQEIGTFVGARLRVPLDGSRGAARATLTAAPTLRSVAASGEGRTRIGEGLEFGIQGQEVRFNLAGRPVSRLVQGGEPPAGGRQNVSTVGWVAIGVGAVALTAFLLYGLCLSGEICNMDDE